MKKLRRVTEAEVIAEFLKSEFYHREFHRDRDRYEQLVMECDITDEAQNALRRALLFRRRGHMWRELPADTQWWEMEVEAEDIPRIRVFPRAQWRKLASGSFLLTDIVKRMRSLQETGKANPFIAKIQSLSYRLRRDPHRSSVLLIGLDTSSPVTILEGNHRLTAALLASPATLQQSFRIFCGLSERMNECCWYRTTLKISGGTPATVSVTWATGRNRRSCGRRRRDAWWQLPHRSARSSPPAKLCRRNKDLGSLVHEDVESNSCLGAEPGAVRRA